MINGHDGQSRMDGIDNCTYTTGHRNPRCEELCILVRKSCPESFKTFFQPCGRRASAKEFSLGGQSTISLMLSCLDSTCSDYIGESGVTCPGSVRGPNAFLAKVLGICIF